jgi:hypothetical protein
MPMGKTNKSRLQLMFGNAIRPKAQGGKINSGEDDGTLYLLVLQIVLIANPITENKSLFYSLVLVVLMSIILTLSLLYFRHEMSSSCHIYTTSDSTFTRAIMISQNNSKRRDVPD